ncbi:MAG: rRNA pseudouridine synthase, partial [Archangium sp.]|nr:rRNA pseudouridine synthase [Archangium sp.]
MLLERALQSQGFGSRRECRELVASGQVAINGQPARNPETEVDTSGLVLTVRGEAWPWRESLYLALHKPSGTECSHQPTHHPSVFTLLPPHFVARGVQCVGRLDEDTTGLLLLSDDGGFVHALSSPKRKVAKVYEVH